MTTKELVDNFHEFARDQLAQGASEFTVDELYSMWRVRFLPAGELTESVSALQASYRDLEAGDVGIPAREALSETCHRLGLVIGE